MARNASGTHSLPSGNPVVSGTSISSTVQNATTADISTEITDSLSRSGKGAMLAPLKLANGTVGAPAAAFDSDTDTGLYRIGANNPALAAGGAKAQEWSATGTTIPGTLAVVGATTLAATTLSGALAGTTGAFSGNLALTGSNPASSTGFASTITPLNICKAWATFTSNGSAGAQTITAGFNVASITLANNAGSGEFTATWGTPMSVPQAYVVVFGHNEIILTTMAISRLAATCIFQMYNTTSGAVLSVAATNTKLFSFVVFGAQ